jgi:hypothetical protein
MLKVLRRLLFVIAIGFFVEHSLSVRAQEVSVSDLRLTKTYLKTTDVPLIISATPTDAFSPTRVNCQAGGPCVLGIELTAQFSGLTPPDPNAIAAVVTVDGSTAEVLPNGVLGLDSTSTGGGSNARSFLWMTKDLHPGPHSVSVQFYVAAANGTAGSATRTLKIDVYRHLHSEDDDES